MQYRCAFLGWALLGLVIVTGCDKKSSEKKTDDPTKNKGQPTSTTGGGPSGTTSVDGAKQARNFTDQVLKDLSEGKAKASDFSVSFKKWVGTPITEEERKAGYSDPETEAWLKKHFEGAKFTINREPQSGETFYYHGRIEKDKNVGAFALWATKEGGGYKVSLLCKTERFLANPPMTSENTIAASECTQAFLDNLLGGDLRFSLALADETYKVKLAPPTDDQKAKGLSYDVGFAQVKLRSMKGDFYEYKLTEIKADSVSGVFIGSNVAEKPFTIKLTNPSGRPLVSDFEIK